MLAAWSWARHRLRLSRPPQRRSNVTPRLQRARRYRRLLRRASLESGRSGAAHCSRGRSDARQRPADAIRNYHRAAEIAPDTRGLAAKISAPSEIGLPRAPRNPSADGTSPVGRRQAVFERCAGVSVALIGSVRTAPRCLDLFLRDHNVIRVPNSYFETQRSCRRSGCHVFIGAVASWFSGFLAVAGAMIAGSTGPARGPGVIAKSVEQRHKLEVELRIPRSHRPCAGLRGVATFDVNVRSDA